MSQSRVSQAGFTLMEMILVALIVSGLLAMYIRYTAQQVETARIARVVTQIQQIENAGLAYYMDNNNWGTTTTGEALTASSNYVQYNYLSGQSGVVPATPWGGSYTIKVNATGGLQLSLTVPDPNTAQLLATRLPIASASGTTVTTQINVPAQVLNKAKSLTSAAIYNHGACVPAPVCPKGMSPQIIVLPTGITGYYGSGSSTPSCTDKSNPATCGTLQAYPLTGYTVSAVGDSSGSPVDVGAGTLNSCDGSTPPRVLATMRIIRRRRHRLRRENFGVSVCKLPPQAAPINRNFWRGHK